jgi:cold shock CspA family protein/tetratricopeptide (TPR) repeat protein
MEVTREQMGTFVYALERDMRGILRRFSALDGDVGALLRSGERKEAEAKRDSDDIPAKDLLEYLDLRPTYDLLSRHKETLPASLAAEVGSQIRSMESINPIRRRLAHSRPLETDDVEQLWSALEGFQHSAWRNLHAAIRTQLADPQWVPPMHERVYESDGILHNVPIPDYDETTLIGRQEFVEKIVALVTSGRNRVVTVTGEGGIGKTAIAYAVAHQILDSEQGAWDAVLWVSLKKERLTGEGITQIRDAIDSLQDASLHLGRQFDSGFSGGLADLGEMMQGLKVLICFDNLETISGDEFVSLYEALPESIQYLVTSRNGIGQLERRFQLGPLKPHHAVALLGRLIATQQAKQLGELSREGKDALCADLRYSPLAIKWLVLAAAAGRPVSDVARNQDELLTFCVRSVYERLSPVARRTLVGLHMLGREGSLGELAILIDEPVPYLARAMQELVQGSLVVSRVSDATDMETLLALTDTARAYLRNTIVPDDPDLLAMARLEAEYRHSEEVRQKNAEGRALAPWIVRTTHDAERPAAHLLHRALLASKAGNFDEAKKAIDRARELAPDFWEVHRVDAFIAGSGRLMTPGGVTQIYLRALGLADSDLARGVVSHFLAGHLARQVNDLEGALRYAEAAHAALASPETEMALGNYNVRAGKFEEGISQIRRAAEESTGKPRLIARTSLMSAYRRYSETTLFQEHSVAKALERSLQGLEIGVDLQPQGVFDRKFLNEFCELQALLLRIERKAYDLGVRPALPADLFLQLQPGLEQLRQSNSFRALQQACAAASPRVESEMGFDSYSQAIGTRADVDSCENQVTSSTSLTGVILGLRHGYGFIEHSLYPTNIFFHASALTGDLRFESLVVGSRVAFEVTEDQGRPRATSVTAAEWPPL